MPSLDNLQVNPNLDNLKIFAINVGNENFEKVNNFFVNLNIKHFESYYDSPTTLAKKFSLRGIPTSILFNKEGKEFARIIGAIDFENKIFLNWIKNFN
jgi:thioredoxin-related protein